MSQTFAGFTGPSYALQNPWASVERCINWYCTPNEGMGETKWQMILEPSPGLVPYSQLPPPSPFNQPNRGLLENRTLLYGVNGTVVWCLPYVTPPSTPTFVNIGSVDNDGQPVSMVANGNGQIFIASANNGYVIPAIKPGQTPSALAGQLQTLQNVAPGQINQFLGSSYAAFQDGYILVITPGTNQFQISGSDSIPVGDALQWNALNVSIQAGQADLLVALTSWREYLYLFGARRSQVYYNAGNSGLGGFPFQSYNETFLEAGLAAPYSLQNIGDSLMWLGQDDRGQRAIWRTSTFQPNRVSTFAVEEAMQNYGYVADAVAMSYNWNGHIRYQITFPTAGKTWEYDATASDLIRKPLWNERQYLNATHQLVARPELHHAYAYGLHMVASAGADNLPGTVYYYYQYNPWDWVAPHVGGTPTQTNIVRDRIAPHIWQGNKRVIYNRLDLEMARGQGLSGAIPLGKGGYDPTLTLRWSNDGGNSWTPEQTMQIGKIGAFGQQIYRTRLGYARDRVFWIRGSDPVYYGIVNAELDMIVCG